MTMTNLKYRHRLDLTYQCLMELRYPKSKSDLMIRVRISNKITNEILGTLTTGNLVTQIPIPPERDVTAKSKFYQITQDGLKFLTLYDTLMNMLSHQRTTDIIKPLIA